MLTKGDRVYLNPASTLSKSVKMDFPGEGTVTGLGFGTDSYYSVLWDVSPKNYNNPCFFEEKNLLPVEDTFEEPEDWS